MDRDSGPGVPEALPRTLALLAERLGPETLDRIWVFPGRIRGRTERGLVAASRFGSGVSGESTEGRRHLFTAAYTAERTGKGLVVDHAIREEGEAPADRLPRVMEGVVRRSGDDLGDPREISLEGDPARFDELMSEFDSELLGSDLPEEPTVES